MVENINRLNAWSNDLINEFDRMVRQHHSALNNFHRVGTMLEESGKIYGLRVDSVHADVIRMSSGIQRQSLGHSYMDSTAWTDLTADISIQSIQPVRRRRITTCTTVVGNKELINAPLQILEELRCPLNRMIGIGSVSATNLFQQVLCSDRYVWTLQSTNKFWTDHNVVNGLDDIDELSEENVDLPVVNWIPSISNVVRPKLSGYQIANTPCEHFRYSKSFTTATLNHPDLTDIPQALDIDIDPVPPNNLEPTMVTIDVPLTTASLNQPDLEDHPVDMNLHFDIGVDPAPVNNSEPTMPQLDVSFTVDDRNALRRCSVLQTNTSVADDLRPLSSTPLSYSYRRLTNIPLEYDAGHWKLPSILSSTSSEREITRRCRRRKIAKKDEPVLFTHVPSDSADQNFMSVDDPRTRAIRMSIQHKWQSTKLTMPSKMGHSSAVKFMPLMLDCMTNEDPTEQIEAAVSDAVLDSAVDNNVDVEPNVEFMEVEMDTVDVAPANVSVPNVVDVEMTIGVTQNVDDHVILPPMPRTPFHITPANVNVKAITRRCLEIIRALETAGGEATFGQVYRQLEADGQRLTPALIFSSILELANRNNFRLEKIGDTNDFVIKRI